MSAYLDGVLATRTLIRSDAKKRSQKKGPAGKCGPNSHWVDDDRVEGGGYCRKNRSAASKARSATQSRSAQSSVNLSKAIGLSAIAIGAAGVSAGAAGFGVGVWATRQGVKQELERVQRESNVKAKQAIAKEAERLKAQSDGKLADAVAAKTDEIRQSVQTESDAQLQKAISTEKARLEKEGKTQLAADLEAQTAAIKAEADQEIERQVTQAKQQIALDFDRQLQTKITETQLAERRQYNQQLKTAREGMTAEINQEVDRLSQEAKAGIEQDFEDRLTQSRSQLQAQFKQDYERQLSQKETQIREQAQQDALERIAKERESVLNEAREQVLAATQPKASRAGTLVNSEKDGIALAASVRQGLDLATVTQASQDRRIKRAVERIVNRHLEQAIADLNASFRDRTKAIQQLGAEPSQSRKALENRLRIRWEAMEKALLSQTRREISLEEAATEQRRKLTEKYKELMATVRESNYSSESITAFDKRSQKLAKQVKRDMNQSLSQILEDIRLDSDRAGLQGRSDAYLLGFHLTRLDVNQAKTQSNRCPSGSHWVEDHRARKGGYCRKGGGGTAAGKHLRNAAIGAGIATASVGAMIGAGSVKSHLKNRKSTQQSQSKEIDPERMAKAAAEAEKLAEKLASQRKKKRRINRQKTKTDACCAACAEHGDEFPELTTGLEQASSAQREKVRQVLREFKQGKLHSGSKDGPVVKKRKQALAIALSQADLSSGKQELTTV